MGILNKDGALYFASGIDNSGLKKDSEEAKQYLQNISNFAIKTGAAIGIGFSAVALKQFGNEIINVRGEIQMLETSFGVLLGGKGVEAFMSQLKQFAVDSPLSLTGVSQSAQTLLGFGVDAEKVIPIIKQLGDVSMGNEERFKSLSLAFAQMSATGKLMGQDLLQMINAGFNPLQTISEKTGKSIGELKKEMEAGSISSQMVADAFATATSVGGKFYGMTQKQAEGIRGLQAQLEGGLQDAFNNIGKSAEETISIGYKGAITLVENYDKVGRVLVALVSTYGAYKAAIITLNAVQSIQNMIALESALAGTKLTTIQGLQAVMVKRLTVAHASLNKTLLANPYVAVATLIVGMAAAMWALHDSTTAAEKAQANYNKRKEDAAQAESAHKQEIEKLIDAATNQYAADMDRAKALIALKNEYPKIFEKYDIEKLKLADILKLKKEIAEQDAKDKRQANKDAVSNIDKEIARIEALVSQTKENIKKSAGATGKGLADQLESYENALNKLKIEKSLSQKDVDLDNATNFLAGASGFTDEQLKKEIDRRKSLIYKIGDSNKVGKIDGLGIFSKSELEAQTSALESELKKREDLLNNSIKKELDATTKNISKFKKELADLRSGKTQSENYALDIENKEKKLKEEEDKLATLTGVDKKSAKEAADKKYQAKRDALELKKQIEERKSKITKAEQDAQWEIDQATINAMKEGSSERINAQIKLDKEQMQERINSLKKSFLDANKELARQEWELDNPKWKEKGLIFDDSKVQLTDEQNRIIQEKQKEHDDYEQTQQDKHLKELLDKYANYAKRRKDINDKANKEIAQLQSLADSDPTKREDALESIKVIKEEQKKALKEVDDEEISTINKTSDLFLRLFGDVSRKSTSTLKKVIADTKILVDYLQGASNVKPIGFTDTQLEAMKDPEKIKSIMDGLISVSNELETRNNYTFSSFVKGFKSLKDSAEYSKKALKSTTDEQKNLNTELAEGSKKKGFEYLLSGGIEVSNIAEQLIGKFKELAEITSNTALSSSLEQTSAILQNFKAAGEGAKSGGWIGAVIGGGMDIINQTIDGFVELKRQEEEAKQSAIDYANALQLINLRVNTEDSVFGENSIKRTAEAWEKARDAVRLYNDYISATNAISIDTLMGKVGEYRRKNQYSAVNEITAEFEAYQKGYTDLQAMAIKTKDYNGWQEFWGATDEYKSLKDLAPEIWQDGIFNVENAKAFLETNKQISPEQRKLIQQAIDLGEAYEDALKIIDDAISDTFNDIGASITDVIFDAVETGADGWSAFKDIGAEVIHSLGKQLVQELFVQSYLDNYREQLREAYGISDAEERQKKIAEITKNIFDGMSEVYETSSQAAKDWNEEAKKNGYEYKPDNTTSGTTGELKQAMTEERGSQLVGLWNMSSMDIRAIKEYLLSGKLFTDISMPTPAELYSILQHVAQISINTGRTADNTDYLEEGLKRLDERLEQIEKNTKPNNSRV